ncbi:M20 family metallopeptidase [Aeromonas schubertii]|uniref:Acetylornithine deacetylase/Succinyl-diaminopimelate desuccinylase n=1 Tax=Aeromonas schubertii TaxID=652 RepID=A0A0S2SNG6_9GAMM|nr:M20 family metallopeptidase [Aeromonas schubertii]ALP43275.1 Acetylornithine deacetylase/Succinyl-diaminopimelate desuccinylase [Aeromonas schubertii]MBZ6067903.1 M20 family metallopeptidase [Aeromonas schubertii]
MHFSLNDYLAALRPLVNVDCGTLNREGNRTVVELMKDHFAPLTGWQLTEVDCGAAGVGLEIRNRPAGEPIDVLMIGHLDTVFPVGTAAARPLRVEGSRAFGPGVSDMKSGLLNILWAVRGLDPALLARLSLCICMNPDEEIGSLHSEDWLKSVAKDARHVLVAEAARADGSLVKARKGMARYRIEAHGKAAHAGNDPRAGRSAIRELAHWTLALDALNDIENGTTLNLGVIQGGAVANIVPDQACAWVDVRFWSNQAFQALEDSLHTMAERPFGDGIRITLTREAYKPSMTPSPETERLMALVERCGEQIGLPITWQAVGGGSDANLTAVMGIPTLDGLGPVGAGFHSDEEYLDLDSVEPRIRLLQRVLAELAP